MLRVKNYEKRYVTHYRAPQAGWLDLIDLQGAWRSTCPDLRPGSKLMDDSWWISQSYRSKSVATRALSRPNFS